MIIDFKPTNGGGGGGGGDMSNYYTKAQVNALIEDFVTETTDDLVNYYLKSETYAKGEVDSLIGAVSGFSYEIAQSTASVVDPQSNVLYLIGPDQTVSGDQYEEYVYSNNEWVKIGDTSIDLAGYVTTSDLNTALANYVTSTSLANTLAGYASLETISTVAISGSYNDLEDKLVAGEGIVIGAGNVISATGATTTLATVATTGDYDDLINKPVIPVVPELSTVATTGSYNDLTDKPIIPVVPELSTVATTGNYNDLTNTPTIPDAVSGVNDGTNWTSLTIGTTTKAIPGGGDMSDYYTKSQTDALVANFITATTDDLVNYYLKSETYAKGEVDNLIGAVSGFSYEIAQSTSAVVDPQSNVLYLIGPSGSGSDQYEEYVYTNNTWTKIGDTSIDLSNYVTVNQLNTALGFYTTTQQLQTLLAGKQDTLTAGDGITIGTDGTITADSQVVSLTQAEYDALVVKDPGVIYIITDATAITLSTVATSGSYNDLTDKPTIPVVPTLATVATSGSYNDLTDKPVIPVVPELSTVATTGDYNDLTNKPSIPDAVSGTNDGTNWTSITIGTETHDIPQGGSSSKIDLALMTPEEQQQFYVDFYVNNAHNYWDYCAMGYNVCGVQKMSQYTEIDLGEGETYVTDGSELGIFVGPDYQFKNGTQWGNEPIDELDNIYYYVWVFSPTDGLIEAGTRIYSNVQPDWNVNDSDNKAFIKNKPSIPDAVSGVNDGTNWTSITIGTTTKAIPAGGGVAQQQADWAEDDTTDVTYIKNKPSISTVATSGSYNDLTDKPVIPVVPTLATVATTGAYSDLTGTPTLATVATTGDYEDLTNKPVIPVVPTLATVATSGSYNDLTDKPTIPVIPQLATVATTGDYSDLSNTPTLATVATSGSYNDLSNTPVLATVATSGSYNDLTDTPTIPTVGTGTVTLTQNGATIGTFGLNDTEDKTIEIPAGGGVGRNEWYGSQYQFDTLGTYDPDTDYYISEISYSEINGTPNLGVYATKTEMNTADAALDNKIAGKMENIVFLGTGGLPTIGTPLEGTVYAIEGETLPLTFTLDGVGTVTYNFVID